MSTTRYGGRDWSTYYTAVSGKPPRETLVAAIEAFAREDAGNAHRVRLALDLGCGEGRDTRELLRRGWSVVAIDPHPAAAGYIQPIADASAASPASSRREGVSPGSVVYAPRLHFAAMTLEAAAASWCACKEASSGHDAVCLPMHVDLVNASFVLPFVPPGSFPSVWSWIRGVLIPGGRFSGQFFGVRDTWATIEGRSHHARGDVERMLDGLEIERLVEDEKDGADAEGNAKHWHVFHVVARR